MSYTILYRSMFVKLSNGKYIPMMEMGDNNVYEPNYGKGKAKRARDWTNINLRKGRKFFDEFELLNSLNIWNEDVESKREHNRNSDDDWKREHADNNFGYYEGIAVYGKDTWATTFNDVKNIIMGGVKNSISFEEAVKECGLHICYWEKTNPNDGMFACRKRFEFSTEEEMFALINEKFHDGLDWYFAFGGKYMVSKFYDMRKAVKGFLNNKGKGGKGVKRFALGVKVSGYAGYKYVSVENGSFGLTDNKADAFVFNKYQSNGVDLSKFIYNTFNDAYSMRYLYEGENEVA